MVFDDLIILWMLTRRFFFERICDCKMRPPMSTRMSARSFSTIYAESNVDKNVGQIIFDELIRPLMSTRMSARSFSSIQYDVGSDNLLLSFSLTEPTIQVDQRERQKNCQTKQNLISENLIQTQLSQKLWNWILFWKCHKDIKFNEKLSQVNKC